MGRADRRRILATLGGKGLRCLVELDDDAGFGFPPPAIAARGDSVSRLYRDDAFDLAAAMLIDHPLIDEAMTIPMPSKDIDLSSARLAITPLRQQPGWPVPTPGSLIKVRRGFEQRAASTSPT